MKKMIKGMSICAFIAFTMVSLESSAVAAPTKLERAITSYEKYVEKAEQSSCNTELGKPSKALSNSCTKAVDALDKRYDKYSDDIKADPKIVSLRERHETLRGMLEGLERQAAIEQMARKYRLKIERMETKTCPEQEHYGSRDFELCQEDLEKTDQIKANIPADMLGEPIIKDLIDRHEALRNMPEHMFSVYKAANDAFLNGVSLRDEFEGTVHDITYWSRLEDGKANRPAANIGEVEGLKENLPAIKQLAANCTGKYAEYIQDKPERQAQCELAENADKYYAQFAAASYKVFLQEETEAANSVVSRLENSSDRYIDVSDYNRLVLGSKEYLADVKERVGESHRLAGLPEPSYAELEAAVANIPVAIKAAASKNRWADKETVSVSRAIEKRTAQVVKKMGMKLVKVGRIDAPWTLVKNALGIPLYKGTKGWVMMKAPKESFCRIQYASFTRTYDGSEYAPASDVVIVPVIVPVKCK